MRPYTIHRPTHTLYDNEGRAIATIQKRGALACVNLPDGRRAIAVESCAYHLTNYGCSGPSERAPFALTYLFGGDWPETLHCQRHH